MAMPTRVKSCTGTILRNWAHRGARLECSVIKGSGYNKGIMQSTLVRRVPGAFWSVISSYPQDNPKRQQREMIFLPAGQLRRGQEMRIALEQNLERTQGPLCQVYQSDQSAEEASSSCRSAVAGTCTVCSLWCGRTFHGPFTPLNVRLDGP